MRFFLSWCALSLALAHGARIEAQSKDYLYCGTSPDILAGDRAPPTAYHHNWHDILHIFAKARSAIKVRNLPLAQSIQLAHSPHASAFVYKRENIRLSKPLIETLRSKDELAFAISHEMAHIALRHTVNSTTSQELVADAFAASLLREMGMDRCASTRALEALQRREPNYREPLGKRIQHLRALLFSDCPAIDSPSLALRKSPIHNPFH
jgi:Zn-dependent protease with chaperone function